MVRVRYLGVGGLVTGLAMDGAVRRKGRGRSLLGATTTPSAPQVLRTRERQ